MQIKYKLTEYYKERSRINLYSLEERKIFNSCYAAFIFIIANNPTLTTNLCALELYGTTPHPYAAFFIYDPNIFIDNHTKELLYVFTQLSYNPLYRYEAALCWKRYNICSNLNPQDWTLNNRHAPIAKIINTKNNQEIASLQAVNKKDKKCLCRIQLCISQSKISEILETNLEEHYLYQIDDTNDPTLINITTKKSLNFSNYEIPSAAQYFALCITQLLLRKQLYPISG